MKTTLLIDINDTLDDGSDFEYREKQHFLDLQNWTPPTWVMWPRKWIEDFSNFLIEYREKLLPIFWTSVWLYGQKHVRYDWLKTDVIGFNGEIFHEFNENDNFSASSIWIWTPKSIDFDTLISFIKWKSESCMSQPNRYSYGKNTRNN